MMRAQCEFTFRCCEPDERLESSSDYTSSEGECAERSAGFCKAFVGGNDKSVSLGRMRFDGDAANACLAGLNAARDQCDANLAREVQRAGGACARAYGVGTVEPGDACGSSGECRLGGGCEIDAEDPDVDEELGVIEGECADRADEGDNCTDTTCGTDLACFEGECEPLPPAGEDCLGGVLCAAGLWCDDGECAPPKADGEDCENGFECLSGECDGGECDSDNTCNGL